MKESTKEITKEITKDSIKNKIIRYSLLSLFFMCILNYTGIDTREAHQIIFMLSGIILFGFFIDNLWIKLFLWWTVFLFAYFKFQIGLIYLTNIFLGSIIYILSKYAFKKEHIKSLIDVFLWLVIINLFYGCIQVLGFDFTYAGHETLMVRDFGTNHKFEISTPMPNGFMGNSSIMAILLALAIPLLYIRRNMLSRIGAFGLLIPIIILRSFGPLLAASIGILFVLFFDIPRKIWWGILTGFILLMIGAVIFIDMPGTERFSIWKMALSDQKVHFLTGWGLDSFRNFTPLKEYIYSLGLEGTGQPNLLQTHLWDNPHNLIVSLAFEFGIIGILLFGAYLIDLFKKFIPFKDDFTVIGFMGFIIIFLIASLGHFPMFLARMAVIIIPFFACYEILTNQKIGQED